VIEAGFVDMTKAQTNAERRNAQRFKICWDVAVNGIDQSGKRFGEEGVLADLSSRGAFLYLTRRLNRGDRLEVQIRIPIKTDNWIRYMAAEIVRLELTNDLTGVGVRFDTAVPVFVVQ
jgi:hypothetical protein